MRNIFLLASIICFNFAMQGMEIEAKEDGANKNLSLFEFFDLQGIFYSSLDIQSAICSHLDKSKQYWYEHEAVPTEK